MCPASARSLRSQATHCCRREPRPAASPPPAPQRQGGGQGIGWRNGVQSVAHVCSSSSPSAHAGFRDVPLECPQSLQPSRPPPTPTSHTRTWKRWVSMPSSVPLAPRCAPLSTATAPPGCGTTVSSSAWSTWERGADGGAKGWAPLGSRGALRGQSGRCSTLMMVATTCLPNFCRTGLQRQQPHSRPRHRGSPAPHRRCPSSRFRRDTARSPAAPRPFACRSRHPASWPSPAAPGRWVNSTQDHRRSHPKQEMEHTNGSWAGQDTAGRARHLPSPRCRVPASSLAAAAAAALGRPRRRAPHPRLPAPAWLPGPAAVRKWGCQGDEPVANKGRLVGTSTHSCTPSQIASATHLLHQLLNLALLGSRPLAAATHAAPPLAAVAVVIVIEGVDSALPLLLPRCGTHCRRRGAPRGGAWRARPRGPRRRRRRRTR